MKAASISEIKNSLKEQPTPVILDLCLRLARYKKENKELLTYLLFEAHDQDGYIKSVKEEMTSAFEEINTTNLYWAKKSLRKILRTANKYIRYTGSKTVEVELLLYYCTVLKESGIPVRKSTALLKLYDGQVKKIETAIDSLHEDLQYEYKGQLNALK